MMVSLVPRPLPVFQCYMQKNRRAWYLKSRAGRINRLYRSRVGVVQPHDDVAHSSPTLKRTLALEFSSAVYGAVPALQGGGQENTGRQVL